MINKHKKIRTKKQWSFYFKENFFKLNPYSFSNLNSRKWEKLKIRFFKHYWRIAGKTAPKKFKTRIRRFKTYYKISLKNKHKFKLYFKIKTEKKFKKLLRTTFKYKKKSDAFYGKLQRRLDIFLMNCLFFKDLETARIFIKNGAILINGQPVKQSNYFVRNIDIVGVLSHFHLYIYNNIKKSISEGKLLKTNNEINFRTLEVVPCGFLKKDQINLIVGSPMALDLIQKSYKR
jgi:ribosomal protein S4